MTRKAQGDQAAPRLKATGWRIPEDLRRRVNIKAETLEKTAEEFVVECLEEATKDVKMFQEEMKRNYVQVQESRARLSSKIG
jgi:predicted DNA-binding protein